jgi:N-6 DNA methylase
MMPTPTDARRETAAKVAALTLANAFIFQEQLAATNRNVRTLRSMLAENDLVTFADKHWEYICESINYVPIFKIAREILLSLPSGSASNDAVQRLAQQALAITTRKAALRHDLMGRIYHWLLHDAKFLGTYYTSVPAGTLLLKLVFSPDRWPNVDWADIEQIRQLKIADIACGTGTLLMAACQAITDNFIRESAKKAVGVTPAKLRDLHQALMEDIIHGYDVLASAIHLTASTLGLLAPEIAFQNMRLYSLPLGRISGSTQVHLGSIDYVNASTVQTQLDLVGEGSREAAAGEVTAKGIAASVAPLPGLSVCVMNPPFVRSVGGNLLFGSFPRDRAAMQQKLRRLLSARGGRGVHANATAGLGSIFAAVADRHIDGGGTLAMVIPAALTTGVAWEKTRALIDHGYDLEVVIISHEAERWSFSENTDLSEILLVARKHGSGKNKGSTDTRFVNLWSNPNTSVKGLGTAAAILRTIPAEIGTPNTPKTGTAILKIGSRKVGEVISVPTASLRGKPWIGCAFAQTDLVRALFYLRDGALFVPGTKSPIALSTCPLSAIGQLGPDRRDIYDGFDIVDQQTAYPAYWGHDANAVTTIAAPPNRWLSPLATAKKGRPLRSAPLLWSRAGRLMIAERMWLVTQRVCAVYLPERSLSNVWWPTALYSDDIRHDKALALWMNSTLGLLMFTGHRVPTRGPWVQFKKPLLEHLPVLDIRKLDNNALRNLASAYDSLSTTPLEPIPELATDEARIRIDGAIRHALSLPNLHIDRVAGSRANCL